MLRSHHLPIGYLQVFKVWVWIVFGDSWAVRRCHKVPILLHSRRRVKGQIPLNRREWFQSCKTSTHNTAAMLWIAWAWIAITSAQLHRWVLEAIIYAFHARRLVQFTLFRCMYMNVMMCTYNQCICEAWGWMWAFWKYAQKHARSTWCWFYFSNLHGIFWLEVLLIRQRVAEGPYFFDLLIR